MIRGYVHPAFAPLAVRFARLFKKPRNGGGALAAYLGGEPVLDVWSGWSDPESGQRWQRDTMALSFSTTKGVVSTLLHRLADRGLVDYDQPVATYWPEFADAGKSEVTVRQLLAHTAGLHDVRNRISDAKEMLDHRHMADVLARQVPAPGPGTRSGYHGFTFGWLVAGLVERITDRDVRDVLAEELAGPLDADGLYFGAPLHERHRLARLFPGIAPAGVSVETLAARSARFERTRPFAEALLPDGFEQLVFDPDAPLLDAAMPAANGVFTARALARLYGALANGGQVDGIRLLSEDLVHEIGRVQTRDRDYVLGLTMKWRLGYHRAFVASRRPPRRGFGHFGFGGSGAWADPETGLSLAFVANRLGNATTPVGDARLVRLGALALRCAHEAG